MGKRLKLKSGPEIDLPILVFGALGICCQVVRAELLPSIAPHLASVASFALHAEVGQHFYWQVSNIETGTRVCGSGIYVVRDDVIKAAQYRLAGVTADKILKAMAACAPLTSLASNIAGPAISEPGLT